MKRSVWVPFILLALLLLCIPPLVPETGYTRFPVQAAGADEAALPLAGAGDELLTTAREYGDRSVHFIGAGDNVIHPNITTNAQKRAAEGGRTYNYRPMYEEIEPLIASADIAFINQETLMAGEEYGYSGYPRFNTPRDLAYDLAEVGFDVVNVANNHMADKNGAGLRSTVDFWHTVPVTLIGGYYDEADFDDIRILEVKDIRIAFLSYTFSTNGIPLTDGTPMRIPYLNEADIRRQTEKAKMLADVVIVSVHWGEENIFRLNGEQRRYAALMAECGVDVIVGHHPHVLQPIEWIERPDGKRTLCVYSLGNLVSTMANGYNMVGGLITFDIVRHSGEFGIENVCLIPTVFFYGENFFNTHIYLFENYTPELAARHGTIYYGSRDDYETLKSYIVKNIAPEFLPAWLQ